MYSLWAILRPLARQSQNRVPLMQIQIVPCGVKWLAPSRFFSESPAGTFTCWPRTCFRCWLARLVMARRAQCGLEDKLVVTSVSAIIAIVLVPRTVDTQYGSAANRLASRQRRMSSLERRSCVTVSTMRVFGLAHSFQSVTFQLSGTVYPVANSH